MGKRDNAGEIAKSVETPEGKPRDIERQQTESRPVGEKHTINIAKAKIEDGEDKQLEEASIDIIIRNVKPSTVQQIGLALGDFLAEKVKAGEFGDDGLEFFLIGGSRK